MMHRTNIEKDEAEQRQYFSVTAGCVWRIFAFVWSPLSLVFFFGLFAMPNQTHAQMGMNQGQPKIPPKPTDKKERKNWKRSEHDLPLPAPLSPEMEAARERAKEKGVLIAEEARPGLIFQLHVVGAEKVEPDAVLVQIQSKIDRRPDQNIIREDVKRIYKMKLFTDIQVSVKKGPNDSVILTYTLIEKRAIGDILFEGASEVSEDDIKEVVDLQSYQVLDIPRIKANMRKVQKLYVDKGFFLAELDYELRPSDGPTSPDGKDDSNLLDAAIEWLELDDLRPTKKKKQETDDKARFADVVFLITEHAKVKVEKIDVVGNKNVSMDDIRTLMQTRENHPFGIFTDWGTYKEELADLDPLAVESVYQDKGYLNVRVGNPRVALSTDKTRLSIYIPVDEGKQYSLSNFDVKGDLIVETPEEYEEAIKANPEAILFRKKDLLKKTEVRAGELFSRTKIATDINAVADRYRDKGYAYVNILPITNIDAENDTVEIILEVESGPRVRVQRIEIVGNEKTQDEVIRREMRLYEGEWYSATAIRLSEQRVTALGFFEEVNVTTRQGKLPDQMVVVFAIKEKATGTFQLGAGFSNAESFIFTGQVAQNNFVGRGVTLSGSIQYSSFRQILDLRYVDPYAFYVFQEPMTLAFSVFNTQRNYIDYLRNSAGADVSLGYPIGRPFRSWTRGLLEASPDYLRPYVPDIENLQLYLTMNGERVEIGEQSFNVRLLGLSAYVPRYTSSFRSSIIFDQRNNRLFPSQGYYLQGSAELAHPWLGSALAPPAETSAKSAIESAGIRDSVGPLKPGILKRNGLVNQFLRLSMVMRSYYSFNDVLPVDGIVLKGNFELGYLGTEDSTLVFEHYYMGGFNTIRGYYPRSIGPVARVGALSPDGGLTAFRVGGNKQLFTNLELEFPIFEQVGIRGVAFFDAGNAYGAGENFFYIGNKTTDYLETISCGGSTCWDARNRSDLPLGVFTSIGIGVRWFSPIGPLRFEWGFPLNRRPTGTYGFERGDDPYQFEFNIGNRF
jgi:outer membrane protein insertion porin family